MSREICTVAFTTSDPMCPQCGGDLRRVRLFPHGADEDGVVYMARICRTQSLYWGRSTDGTWSVPVTPMHFH
jgi:hypothetical protein